MLLSHPALDAQPGNLISWFQFIGGCNEFRILVLLRLLVFKSLLECVTPLCQRAFKELADQKGWGLQDVWMAGQELLIER